MMKTGISRTYLEGNGANMWSEVLFDGPSIAELVTWGYHPETHGCIGIPTHPSMHSVSPVFTWVLVFVIHLSPTQKPSFLRIHGYLDFRTNKGKDSQTNIGIYDNNRTKMCCIPLLWILGSLVWLIELLQGRPRFDQFLYLSSLACFFAFHLTLPYTWTCAVHFSISR